MSIYIPGMDMQKSCISCPFMISRDNDDCILQSEESNESFENWEQMKAGCPLVEVPPHGRLIDADALWNRAFDVWGTDADEHDTNLFLSMINDAETIIPADREEDGADA